MTLSELRAHPYGPTEKQLLALCDAAEALPSIRVFVQDCIETGYDRGSLGNLYATRDACDAALSALRDAGLEVT